MPRWKALPEGLDPEVSEFTSQLRRLVDRSGLSIAAVADRTGYSKTSWERYLSGRLLPPKGAVVALAEVTGTHQVHLTTMWELAERAWSRSEMRHDMTMEAIRISQARTALADSGKNPVVGAAGASGGGPAVGSGRGRGTVPPQGTQGAQGSQGAHRTQGTRGTRGAHGAYGTQGAPHSPPGSVSGGPGDPGGPVPGSKGGRGGKGGRRKVAVFVSGVVGALVVVAAAFTLTSLGGDGDGKAVAKAPAPEPSTSEPVLPEGVKCAGDACAGKDPEDMGCGGEFAETVASATVGTALVEVRYSKTCGAAWARITQAALGDEIRIDPAKGRGQGQSGSVETNTNGYTAMSAAPDAASVKACATLTTGETGCTTPDGEAPGGEATDGEAPSGEATGG
ncbi:helix-turn-helix domain-containing protein [Streptomyces sp. NPDC101062]|uniref:helix-turn-helix domain-containing protein n=1 Tax=unclassified Streptomyces TaxID=2593676 RepID=UPI003818FAD9